MAPFPLESLLLTLVMVDHPHIYLVHLRLLPHLFHYFDGVHLLFHHMVHLPPHLNVESDLLAISTLYRLYLAGSTLARNHSTSQSTATPPSGIQLFHQLPDNLLASLLMRVTCSKTTTDIGWC